MKKTVSFLTGSGFSIPAGLPGVQRLNERMSKIDESEIMIHSSMVVIWLKGREDRNRFMNWDQRHFVQDFLEFYNSEVLKENESFHYETFYDYYSSYLHSNEHKQEIEEFYRRFGEKIFKVEKDPRSCRDRMNDFNNAFNQLLAAELTRPEFYENVSYSNYPMHGGIFGFVNALVPIVDVKFHTLNHDMFFESVASNHDGLFKHFSDGFQLEGSPFYGRLSHTFKISENQNIQKSYYVKLARYMNRFDSAFAYYKLHGSTNNSVVYGRDGSIIRIKGDYPVSECHQEMINDSGQPYFQFLFDQVHPDFLSGTTNKTRYYTGDPYYKELLEHFRLNLSNSEFLFVIGYGFQDGGINVFLEQNYLVQGKKMVVISPSAPNTDLIDKYGAIHVPKSVCDVSFDEYMSFLPFELDKA